MRVSNGCFRQSILKIKEVKTNLKLSSLIQKLHSSYLETELKVVENIIKIS